MNRHIDRYLLIIILHLASMPLFAARYEVQDITSYFNSVVAINNAGKIIGMALGDNKPIVYEPDINGVYSVRPLAVADYTVPATPVTINYSEIHLTGISNSGNTQEKIEIITGWYIDAVTSQKRGIYWVWQEANNAYIPYVLPLFRREVFRCPANIDSSKLPPGCIQDGAQFNTAVTQSQTNCPGMLPVDTNTITEKTPIPIECDVGNAALSVDNLGRIVGTSIQKPDALERATLWIKRETPAENPADPVVVEYFGYDMGYLDTNQTIRRNGRAKLISRDGNTVYGELQNPDTLVFEPTVWLNVKAGSYDFPIKLPRKNSTYWRKPDLSYEFRPTSKYANVTSFDNLPLNVTSIDGTTLYGYYVNEASNSIPIIINISLSIFATQIESIDSNTIRGYYLDKNDEKITFSWPLQPDITKKTTYNLTAMQLNINNPATYASDGTGFIRGAFSGEVVGTSYDSVLQKNRGFLNTGPAVCGLQDLNELLAPPYNDGRFSIEDVVTISADDRPNTIIAKAKNVVDGSESILMLKPTALNVDLTTTLTTDHNELFVGQAHNYWITVSNISFNSGINPPNYATCVYISLTDSVLIGQRTDRNNNVVDDWKPGGLTFSSTTISPHGASNSTDPNQDMCTITYVDVTCRIGRIDPDETITIFVRSEPRPLMADRQVKTTSSVTPFETDINTINNQQDHFAKINRENCFIATAAFGSYLDPQVKTLRQFRDQYLLTNSVGRAFVEWYYAHSPRWADALNRHAEYKPWVRTALLPIITITRYPAAFTGLLLIFLALKIQNRYANRKIAFVAR